MPCVSCAALSGPLCRRCRSGLRPAGERRLPNGLLIRSAFEHDGTARRLVHHLKYRGIVGAAAPLAESMAALVPPGSAVLVPVPRVLARLARYGIDPAWELARQIGHRTGLPVLACLVRPLWWPRRAGPASIGRGTPVFRARRFPGGDAVLVDDVMTTGTTLAAAGLVLPGVRWAVTATIAPSGGSARRYDAGGPLRAGRVREGACPRDRSRGQP